MDKPSTRKLIKDIKHENKKLSAWLNSLKGLNHTPKTALTWAHLASLVQTSEAIITCARHKHHIVIPAIVRTAGDCVVNCRLMIDQCDDESALMGAWMEKVKFGNKITNQARQAYKAGEIRNAEEYKAVIREKMAAIQIDNTECYYEMEIDQRWKAINQEQMYHTCYSLLSSEVHSNPGALDGRHTAEIDGTPTLVWCGYEEDEAQDLLMALATFMEWANPCFQYLSDSLAKLNE
ncbi:MULTISPECIES: DUF5677 domain-containing protein [unclassified Pseudodesulfovibrio]|uniref:DUF5677 domain-containing protein n=1 Tax=unclassified Pseudodesulfovibrio TaxID=2661612 RepID=UPI000FEBC579|nr:MULTISPECIES: DUF5677 domain-containing protein [unclassified Pseudodesulfovibrio]MCJ2164695.1 DUF5677 domain-containing protein [Pseudodesulfovibrio sp. S3-i]RWU04113.1 hypothetical protein DWB63_08895 [Pseudodesulfovibrio sp. S3]